MDSRAKSSHEYGSHSSSDDQRIATDEEKAEACSYNGNNSTGLDSTTTARTDSQSKTSKTRAVTVPTSAAVMMTRPDIASTTNHLIDKSDTEMSSATMISRSSVVTGQHHSNEPTTSDHDRFDEGDAGNAIAEIGVAAEAASVFNPLYGVDLEYATDTSNPIHYEAIHPQLTSHEHHQHDIAPSEAMQHAAQLRHLEQFAAHDQFHQPDMTQFYQHHQEHVPIPTPSPQQREDHSNEHVHVVGSDVAPAAGFSAAEIADVNHFEGNPLLLKAENLDQYQQAAAAAAAAGHHIVADADGQAFDANVIANGQMQDHSELQQFHQQFQQHLQQHYEQEQQQQQQPDDLHIAYSTTTTTTTATATTITPPPPPPHLAHYPQDAHFAQQAIPLLPDLHQHLHQQHSAGTGVNANVEEVSFSVSVDANIHKKELYPVLMMDIAKTILTDLEVCEGLSKPLFSPLNDGRFLCGTENQDESRTRFNNRLIFGKIEAEAILENRPPKLWSFPITEHVRDLDWLDYSRVVLGLNQKLGLAILKDDDAIEEIVLFPDFHTDTIREIAVNPKNNSLVLSGGFDGNVFVTNIIKLVEDIQKHENKSENSVYLCKDPVGSVSWHPNDYNVASCTTDLGVLHVFDIRTEQSKPAFLYDTGKLELFSHAYMDDFTVLLGYGDGQIQIHDIRTSKGVIAFQDPCQNSIGEICFAANSNQFAVFGTPQVSVWRHDDFSIQLWSHHMISKPTPDRRFYKTSGQFVPGTSLLAATDSAGMFCLYDLSN